MRAHEICKDDRLAITLRNGFRIAGKAIGRIQSGRGIGYYFTVRGIASGRLVRVEGSDVDRIQFCG